MKFLPVLILAVAFVGVAVADRRDRQLCYLARKMKFVYYAVHDVFYTVHSIEKKIDDCPCGAGKTVKTFIRLQYILNYKGYKQLTSLTKMMQPFILMKEIIDL